MNKEIMNRFLFYSHHPLRRYPPCWYPHATCCCNDLGRERGAECSRILYCVPMNTTEECRVWSCSLLCSCVDVLEYSFVLRMRDVLVHTGEVPCIHLYCTVPRPYPIIRCGGWCHPRAVSTCFFSFCSSSLPTCARSRIRTYRDPRRPRESCLIIR